MVSGVDFPNSWLDDNAINLLKPRGCYVGFKVYESVAKFDSV